MGLGITAVEKDGIHWLSGAFDEFAELEPLLALPGPVLRFNLRGVRSVNSLGLRKLIQFAFALGDRKVELHECPPVFVESVNIVPNAIGGVKHIDRIRSLLLPMTCQDEHASSVVVPMADIDFKKGVATLPGHSCPKCGMPVEPDLDTDVDDFLFFYHSAKGA